MMTQIKRALLCTCFLINFSTFAMNLLRPYDTLIRPDYTGNELFQLTLFGETGISDAKGYDSQGNRVNVLQIWSDNQNGLRMLDGFPADSTIGKLRIKLDASDNGERGHFCVDGSLKLLWTIALAGRYFFLDQWSLALYIPVNSVELKNVRFIDKTRNITPADQRVKHCLTDNFAQNVRELGNVDISGWKRTGLGDIALFLEWFRDFDEPRPLLKNVRINWRTGILFPTGLKKDEDLLFAFSFGNDRAFALPFGLGLDVTLGCYLKLGLDVQLTHIFGNIRDRRIITARDQSELVLLAKVPAYKDFGLDQRFNLYFEFYRVLMGLSVKVGYQFFKQGDTDLSFLTNEFSNAIANTAIRLQEWTSHQMIVKVIYDFGVHMAEDAVVKPELCFYSRLPFNGKRAALFPVVGAYLNFNF